MPPGTANITDKHGNTALHHAFSSLAKDNKITEVCKLLILNMDPEAINAKNYLGKTVLHIAAAKGNQETCRLFIKINPTLINDVDNRGKTALDIASEKGYREICKMLSQTQDLSDTSRLIHNQPLEDGCCGCTLFSVLEIKYDNPLLNKPKLLDTALTKFSLNSILNLSQGIPDNLLSQIINNNDSELLLGALMSLDGTA